MAFRGLGRGVFVAAVFAALWGAPPLAARQLHWEALEVEATLESDGTLAISERQRIVFSGDWNGGERNFRIRRGQAIEIVRIVRTDVGGPIGSAGTGESRELQRGDLDNLDHWNWTNSNVVRWRSRLPSDPEFADTRIDYRIDYRLTGALVDLGNGRYRMEHDFAFAERDAVIQSIEARLSLGAGWRATSPHPVSWQGGPLAPGQGFVVHLELEHTGDGMPASAARVPLSRAIRWEAVAVFVAAVVVFLFGFLRRDRALGRFGDAHLPAGAAIAAIDHAWLESNVFALAPEVVGAAWDHEVGSSEVAALLARLTVEGKLASEVKTSGKFIFKRDDLHLRLLVPREGLEDYERALIDGLFGQSDVTDTASIRARYRRSGFDPAAKIRKGVEARVGRVRGFAEGSPKPSWIPTGLLFLTGLALLVAAFVLQPQHRALAGLLVIGSIVPWTFLGMIPAVRGQSRIGTPWPSAVGILLSMSVLTALVAAASALGGSWMHVGGILALAIGLARSTFNLLKTRDSAAGLAHRRELLRAREFFERELRQPEPRLEDRWFPYLLALGLAPDVDRWFKRFGAAVSRPISTGAFSGGGGGSGSSAAGGWSGGGGSFGGGGASATWAAAATAMSAGVSSASSSSGGGGGSSSGGGGGGGW